mgnify:CR=1 FL=1
MTTEQRKWLRKLLERARTEALVDLQGYAMMARKETPGSFDARQVKTAEARKANAEAWLKEVAK